MKVLRRSRKTLRQALRGALSPSIALATTLYAAGFSAGAHAQVASPPASEPGATADLATEQQDTTREVVIVTGTRRVGMEASDSPAPVQVLPGEMLLETGATDLMNALATQTPSFSANQTGGDMASQTLTAQMRALSPNHALVLVNGKRRHITSNVAAGSGAMAADMSFIPSAMIERVEVLTDGAAALYGSDAIAGVFNVILKDDYEGGSFTAGYSGYEDGGGEADTWQGNWGFGNEDAYFNIGFEVENRESVARPSDYGPGACMADKVACQAYLDTGYLKYGSTYRNGALAGYLASNDVNMVFNPEFPYLNHVGDPPEIHRKAAMFNTGWHINDHMELYGYGSFGEKQAKSHETYRRPSQDGGVDLNRDGDRSDTVNGVRESTVNFYPYGFTPFEESDERDFEAAIGLRGDTDGWWWDVATAFGKSKMDVFTTNSMNFTLWNQTGTSPTDFYDGTYWSSQWTTTANVSKDFNVGLANPMTFATGIEFRQDEYGIKPGEPASYYGSGAASFPGYNPAVNTGSYDRNSYAGFVNFILEPTDNWLVDIAGRYENYSDFGDETIGKITTRYDFADWLAFRGTASTGFRAPTLGEEYYSAVNVGPTSASPQLQPNGAGAAALGFGDGLQPETSTNFSAGFVLNDILPNLTMTLDAYEITIDDRVGRGSFAYSTGQGANTRTGCAVGSRPGCLGLPTNSNQPDPADTNGDGVPDAEYNQALGDALVAFGYIGVWNNPGAPGGSLDSTARASISVSLFNNALSTRTRGVDWVANYSTSFDWGDINWSLAANYNDMEVLEAKAAPAALGGAVMYSPLTLRNMETGDSKYRVNIGARISMGDFTLNLRETIYGPQYTLTSASALPPAVRSELDIVPFLGVPYYKSEIGVMALFNMEATWEVTDAVRISVGADNVFNQYPDKIPKAVWDYQAERYANSQRRYLTGSPVGYFGRKLFAKVSTKF
ncbi:MAG TPA: TonB-dependent receptor [Hyphomonadaceae bacterium]|nr:TonB-dependent receptor [Hyphomonadaceae bacterium]